MNEIETRQTNLQEMYELTREPWGGATVDLSHLLSPMMIVPGSEAYAVTVKTDEVRSVHIALGGNFTEFCSGLFEAMRRFAGMGKYIGIFHNVTKGVIEFDPVIVVRTKAEVDALPAAQHPDFDGAYEFHTGNGYYPNGR